MKLNLSILIVSLSYLLLVTIGVFSSCLTFGHGLGDIGMIIILTFINLITLSIFLVVKRQKKWNIKYMIMNLLIVATSIVYFTISLTTGRGTEYLWDGNFFHC